MAAYSNIIPLNHWYRGDIGAVLANIGWQEEREFAWHWIEQEDGYCGMAILVNSAELALIAHITLAEYI